jgi:hypothetical protein
MAARAAPPLLLLVLRIASKPSKNSAPYAPMNNARRVPPASGSP